MLLNSNNLCKSRHFSMAVVLSTMLITHAQADIVINEIHYDPEPKTEPVEFIELHNTGSSAVDLSGWQFTDGVAFTFPAATSIPAGGYLVITENPTAFQAKFSSTALGPWTGSLSNDGENIELKNAQGVVEDEVDYGIGFPWPLGSRGTGASMELINPSLDNNIGGCWRAAGEAVACEGSGASSTFIPEESVNWSYHKGTSSPSNDGSGRTWWQDADFTENANWLNGTGTIGFGESFLNTLVSDMSGSYRQLFLRKTFTVADTTGINALIMRARFDDGVKIWINGTPVYNLLAPSPTATPSPISSRATSSRSETDGKTYIDFTLNNPLPTTYLVNGTNVIAIQLFNRRYTGDCFFDCSLKEAGAGGGGGSSSPSPGVENNSFSTDVPPQVRQLNHSPEVPTDSDPVSITAKVTDPDGVQSVTLHYQIVDPGSYIRRQDAAYEDVSNWINLTMVDDGSGGDLASGDSIFTAVLPASVQVHRRLVRYRVTVTDNNDHCIRLPYADDPQPNFAYYCYNGVPAWTAKFNSSSSNVTYSSAELSRVPVYQLIAQNNDVENSQWSSGSNEQYFEGTMFYDGVVYDHMKFRNKGSGSTYRMGHNKWKLNFVRGHRFQARGYYGDKFDTVWDKFSIQTGESPWWRNDAYPMSGMLFQESLMSRLNNLTGVLAPEMLHFHFRVVDNASESNPSDQYAGDFWGIYTAQQHPDSSFFDQNKLPSSNLYKLNDSNANSASKWNQGGTQVDDASDLSDFINGYKNTNDPAWWAANMERHSYYTWNVLNFALNNSDLRKEQNVIYWHNADTGQWHPCIWDVDLLFEDRQHHNRDPYAWWEDLHRILNHSVYNIEYQNRVREMQDLLLWNGQYDRTVDEMIGLLTNTGSTTTNTLVDANQAMWERHPRKNYKDGWYRIEGSTYWNGMPDMVNYIKAFPKPGGFGGDQLEGKSLANADTTIPNKPTISYGGSASYPTTGLSFNTTAFSDSSGSATSIQWRLGEIYDPNVSNYTAGEAWKYEISPVWESGEIPWGGSATSIDIPVTHVKVGHTYRARVRHKDSTGRWSRWSDPLEFLTTAADITAYQNALVVSEVHYNPLPPTGAELGASLDNDEFEFIELMNVGTVALDLTGVRLADGITFDFTDSAITSLAPGERVLVVENTNAFEARYGTGLPIAGEYSGKLSNSGELIRLAYGDGNTAANLIRSFTYDDIAPWPADADGTGPSMVLQNPWSVPDHNIGTNWRASHSVNGQPGVIDSFNYAAWRAVFNISPALPTDDPDRDELEHLVEYFLGTDPLLQSFENAPTAAIETLSIGGGTDEYYVYTFQRDMNVEDLSFVIQESTGLDLWNNLGVPVLIDATPAGDSLEILRYRSSQPVSAYTNGKLFMRMQVTETP